MTDQSFVDAPGSLPWYRRARRWTQLTFVEDDPLHFDREFWRDVMLRTRSNAACISAGGYVAYYPTQVAHHYRSRHLGDLDLFGMVNEDARQMGMVVVARIDPHAVHASAAQAHPEWIARDENGAPVPHWAFPGIWLTCPFSTYYSEFVVEITREIVGTYGVDAVFANRWEGSTAISYSEGARRAYFDATGHELPTGIDRSTAEWTEYFGWRTDYLSRQIVEWDRAVRNLNPRGNFIPNRGGLLTRDLNVEIVKDLYPAFYVDKQGRAPGEAIWSAGRVGKRARGLYPDRPVTLISSVGPEHRQHRWKDSVAAPPEVQAWIADGFVHGALPWFTKFNARVADPRWVGPLAEVFTLHERAEELYGGKRPAARVAVLDTAQPDGSDPPWSAYHHDDLAENGVCQALIEARIPFEFIAGDTLTLDRIRGFRAVVMPDNADVTDAQVAMLRDFVAGGGSVVADLGPLRDSGSAVAQELAELFGVRVTGAPRTGVRNNYMAVTAPEHPVAAGFVPAERIVGGTTILPIEASANVPVPFRFVPDFPDLPMEEVYAREPPRDPAVVLREHAGGGRTAYSAFNLSALFWETLQADHAELLAATVRWALAGDEPVTVSGAGLIDLAVRESASGVAVSMVNLDNPKAMRGQLRSLHPLGPQTVQVAAPAGVTTATVHTLNSGTAEVAVADGRAAFTVAGVELLEIVDFTWR
jgi:Hypothetical glycosyl hydrolase 6